MTIINIRRPLRNEGRRLQEISPPVLDPAPIKMHWAEEGEPVVTGARLAEIRMRHDERIDFRIDDLSGEPTRRLIERHLRGMHESSPPESIHAFNVDKLRGSGVMFWSAWIGEQIVGCGALKRLDSARGEIKSMRVDDLFLGRGIGRAILQHLLSEARRAGLSSIWLETGSTESFIPALRLYESAGFIRCGPFDDYVEDPFSVFMTLRL